MILKTITLQNFKNFDRLEKYSFSNINLIKGDNGKGKTTLGVNSLLFGLYGYADQILSSLITKGKKSCIVNIDIIYNNDRYIIERKYPTELSINKNGKQLNLVNNQEKQLYLNQTFKTLDYFRKFRMVDVKEGINILEEGNISLKETLFSIHQDKFNSIRKRLLEKKREREIYNKDIAVIYNHYPSFTRLNLLSQKLNEVNNSFIDIEIKLNEERDIHQRASKNYNKKLGIRELYKNQEIDYVSLIEGDVCPTCYQKIDRQIIENIVEEVKKKIDEIDKETKMLEKELFNEEEVLEELNKVKFILNKKREQLQLFKFKLEGRLKQKDYKYTTRDALIIKKTIEELDNFSSYYLTEWIKTLEPIINSIISKIEFVVKFTINNKNNLEIKLFKDDIEYTYKDLSTGQKLILSIAFKLAILLERNETGLIIADEGLANLDYENLMLVFELFRNLPFQLVCMLHRFENEIKDINVIQL